MEARITKTVLKQLNAARGKLDRDSGKVFDQFVGRLEMSDKLYHGELQFSDPGDDPPADTISVASIISGTPSAVDMLPTPESEDIDG